MDELDRSISRNILMNDSYHKDQEGYCHERLRSHESLEMKAYSFLMLSVAAEVYSVDSIPDNLLINPEGIVVARGLRGEALAKKLAEAFN